MIQFKPIDINERTTYLAYRRSHSTKGCEYSFSNLLLWGNQQIAYLHGCALIYAEWGDFKMYAYPEGDGDRKSAIADIIQDASEKRIPLRICSLDDNDKEEMEALFPGQFQYRTDRDHSDYVYDIHALADLTGKKLHKKRTHINRFLEAHPDWKVVPMTAEHLPLVQEFTAQWYQTRLEADPEGDFDMEQIAMERAFAHFEALQMEGLLLYDGDRLLAFTIGSRMTEDTFDTHFEKALGDVQGAYTIINREFARYLRDKYPELRYIDREDDMGLEGLRHAKLSYAPNHLIMKTVAFPADEIWEEEDEEN